MQYADAMAFPFAQHLLMQGREDLVIDPEIVMDACHVTTVSPLVTDMTIIQQEHAKFERMLVGSLPDNMFDAGSQIVYGLQCPPVGATIENLQCLYSLGIDIMTLAYEMPTEYGGGFATPEEPLSDRGKWLIDAMAELGMVLDLSHAGHRTARDAVAYIKETNSTIRTAITHTGCYEVYPHLRNTPDDVLRSVAELGGLVGLVTITWLLDESLNTTEPFLRQLDHLANVVGPHSVCLGTDGVYANLDLAESKVRFEQMLEKLDPRGNFNPRFPEEAVVLAGPTRLRKITELLESSEKHPTFVEMVMGRNLVRFFEQLNER